MGAYCHNHPRGGVGGALAAMTTSSILRIMDAPSIADLMACSCTFIGSNMPSFIMSVILPVMTFILFHKPTRFS